MLATLLSIVAMLLLMVVLGLIIAFSPTLFFMELAILTRSKNPFRQTIVFLCGIATPIVILVLLGIFFLDPNKTYELSLPSLRSIFGAIPITTIVIGIASMVFGGHLLKQSSLPKKRPKQRELEMRSSMIYWFACLRMSLSISSIAALLLAMRLIKTMVPYASVQTLGFLWLIAMALLPFVAIMAVRFLWPAKFSYIQNVSDRAASFDYHQVLGWILIIIGLLLVLLTLLTQA